MEKIAIFKKYNRLLDEATAVLSYVTKFSTISLYLTKLSVIFRNKGVKRRASTMYFYITEYEQYIHSGSDPQIHNWLASGESILPLPS